MKRNTVFVGAIVLVVALAGGGVALYRGHDEALVSSAQAQQPVPPVAVQTVQPARRSVSRLVALPGDVHAWEETTLFAKVPGYLDTIPVDKGDRVKAGAVLATIQAPELQADRAQAQQTYAAATATAQGSQGIEERTEAEQGRAKAAAAKAEADYAQMSAALARAHAQLKQYQGGVRQAQAQKQQAQAALEESETQVEKSRAETAGALAEQQLADVTYTRYKGIYDKNPLLIAKQDVDTAESRAVAARSKLAAAQSAVTAAQRHVASAQAQVSAADAQIEQANAQLNAAEEQINLTLAQQNSLRKQVDVAQQEIAISAKQQGVTQAQVAASRSLADAGRSALARASAMSGYTQIRAPFSGVVTHRFVDPGAFIQTASTSQNAAAIVTVAKLDPVRVYINIPETEARFVKVGTPVTITLTSAPDMPIKGRIARQTASLDPKTRTLLTEADLPNRDGAIFPGAYATAKVVMDTHLNVVSVPSLAVGVEKAGKFVYVVENSHARRVAVTVGFNDGDYTEIVDGLHGGEQVVVTGRDALTPNAPTQATPWIPPVKHAGATR